MIYRVFFILCFLLTSCKKEDGKKEDKYKPYNITLSGVVTDQVTGQPVEGASVSVGIQNVWIEGLLAPEQSTSTGWDGRYELVTKMQPYTPSGPHRVSPGQLHTQYILLIASKSGFIVSDRQGISYYSVQKLVSDSVLDLHLYHSSELNLHIKNDTTNNIDTVDIKLVRDINFITFTELTIVCNKRKQDSTYVIENLFGNWEYGIQVLKPGGQPFSPPIKYSFTPKPDTINSFQISF
jgi:hypothetical protein